MKRQVDFDEIGGFWSELNKYRGPDLEHQLSVRCAAVDKKRQIPILCTEIWNDSEDRKCRREVYVVMNQRTSRGGPREVN